MLRRLVERATRPPKHDPLACASAPASQIFRLGYFSEKSGDAMSPRQTSCAKPRATRTPPDSPSPPFGVVSRGEARPTHHFRRGGLPADRIIVVLRRLVERATRPTVAEACSGNRSACPPRGSPNERLDRAGGHPLAAPPLPHRRFFASATSAKNQAMRWARRLSSYFIPPCGMVSETRLQVARALPRPFREGMRARNARHRRAAVAHRTALIRRPAAAAPSPAGRSRDAARFARGLV